MKPLFKSEAGRRFIHDRYRSMIEGSPLPLEQLRIPTNQGETFVIACGSTQAPPVVLFHGGAVTSAMWFRSMGSWSQRFRVYAIDLIGEPGFSAPSRPSMQTDAHARWLDDVWRALGLTRPHLVGASQGGWLALDYAIRRPSHVRSLALLSPAGLAPARLRFVFRVLPLIFMGARGRRRAIDYALGGFTEPMDADTRAFLALCELVMAHFVFRTQPFPLFSDDALRTLTMPAMAVFGGKDAIFSASKARDRLVRALPHAVVHYLPEAAHGLTDQTATIMTFLERAEHATVRHSEQSP